MPWRDAYRQWCVRCKRDTTWSAYSLPGVSLYRCRRCSIWRRVRLGV